MTAGPLWTRTRARAGTVRVRTTVAAVAIVGAALLLGGVVLVVAVRHTLTGEARTAASLRAHEVAATLTPGPSPPALAVGTDDSVVIQVVNRRGRVVAASPNFSGKPAITLLPPGRSTKVNLPAADEHPFIAVTAAATTGAGPLTVIVARTLDTVDESTRVVASLLVVGLPVLLLVVAVTTWRVVGGALAPVEAIRAEVDEISAAELHRRVPNPAGSDEISRLAATMNRMLDRLQQSHDRQRRFISDASHELRSPVATIRQHAEVALAHPERTSVVDLAGTVLAEDLRVQSLVDDLLLLARADEHTLNLRHRPVDLDDLVFDEARRLRGGTALGVDTTAVSAGRVTADIASLHRVLRNVVDNAARHARSRVAFRLVEADGAVVLDVDDDGPGVPAADRGRVFERFVRLDDARARDDGGGGLGLAIVSELIAAHGGSVTMTEGPLGGARLTITLTALLDGSG